MIPCRHLGPAIGHRHAPQVVKEYLCEHPKVMTTTPAECRSCPYYQPAQVGPIYTCRDLPRLLREKRKQLAGAQPRPQTSKPPPLQTSPSGRPHPPGLLVDRYGRDANLADLYLGAGVFLILGGPSTRKLPLQDLDRPGVVLASFNNNPAVLPGTLRPHVWLHTDPAPKFHWGLWADPRVLKLVPVREWHRELRRRDAQGNLVPAGRTPRGMPAVLGYHRNTTFNPDTWLYEPSVNRGNDQKSAARNGWPHVINTLFAALRLLFYLGFSRVYLVGCDWQMRPEEPYGFAEQKSPGAVRANNEAFRKMEPMLEALRPRLEAAGCRIWNVTPGSHLEVFPKRSFADALEEETSGCPQSIQDTQGWYEKDR